MITFSSGRDRFQNQATGQSNGLARSTTSQCWADQARRELHAKWSRWTSRWNRVPRSGIDFVSQ